MESVPIDVQYYLMILCSVLSITGSIFILFTSIFKSEIQVFYTKIVIMIACSDIVRSILFMIPCNKLSSELGINLVAILIDSSFLITILWSTYISLALYLVVVKSKVDFDKNYKYWFFSSFFLIPLLNIFPSFTESHGVSGTICTLTDDKTGEIWRYSLMYIPAWVMILFSSFACLSIYTGIQSIKLDEIQEYLVKKLILYPIILILEFLPTTICSVLETFKILDDDSVLSVITLNLFVLHGASNSVIFAINLQKFRDERERVMSSLKVVTAKGYGSFNTGSFNTENLLLRTFTEGFSDSSKS